ncbi:aminotransferase class V-fold PLP-dependent enzyme [Streptomyces kanamyceticus]|uniref:Aminotransferase class V-fold PLP-dependent enzyme n=1 Tax=Streptomyces kanamyceticus TaxID=1967 RepID=A0A5J6GLT1_STRKN|nr:aminotransferase class V-fold PLP-dependent enzyme [Streptomyces kanamyceticus]
MTGSGPTIDGVTHTSIPAPAAPAAFPGGAELFRLGPRVAHLNHGSFGAVPLPVSRVQRQLAEEADDNPDEFFLGVADRVADARTRIAAHIGADPAGTALVSNATEAANLALDALRLAPDDEVLVTDHGYGTVVAAAARRARVRTVALGPDLPDEDAVRAAVLAGLTSRTRVALLDHISSPTARFIATPALLADLAERGVTTVVDGAHAPGMLAEPLAGGPDFWFGNLHKWGYAPPGSALLVTSPAHRDLVPAPVPSWEDHRGYPRAVEYRATVDYTGWLAAPEGLDLLTGLGPDRVRAHNSALAAYGAELLARLPGLTPLPSDDRLAMRALRLPSRLGRTQDEAVALREEIATRLGCRVLIWAWPGGGGIRICGQVYNAPAEYERLATGLRSLLDGR